DQFAAELRTSIVEREAAIKSVEHEILDLLVAVALAEVLRFPARRRQRYRDLRLALRWGDPPLSLPRTPINKLIQLAKQDVARIGGADRWPHTSRMLRTLTEGSATIEPKIT